MDFSVYFKLQIYLFIFFRTKYFVLFDHNRVFLSLFGIFFDSYVVFVDFVFYLCKNIDQRKPPSGSGPHPASPRGGEEPLSAPPRGRDAIRRKMLTPKPTLLKG
jgi:hypothetical protein